jgi:hypothetical protein
MMEYVGWKSIQSAMRYIDSGDRRAPPASATALWWR